MRHIMYRGRQKNRPDDVLKTSRVWEKWGAVIDVEDNEAPHYLRHADEWTELSDAQLAEHKAKMDRSEKVVGEIGAQWGHLSLDEMKRVRTQLDTEISARERQAPPAATPEAVIAASSTPVAPSTTNPDTIAAAAERQAKILKAIGELDDKNPEDYAMAPRHMPRVGRVSEVAGFKVTQAEVLSALELSQKAKAA